jgi:hypothetical protein
MALKKLMALDDRPILEQCPVPPLNPQYRPTTSTSKLHAVLPAPIPQPSPEEIPQDKEQTPAEHPAPFRKTRIIQSANGTGEYGLPVPQMYLSGNYLTEHGFGVGRQVDVIVEKDKITIVPTDPDSPPVDLARLNRIIHGRAQMKALVNRMMGDDLDETEKVIQEMLATAARRKKRKKKE